LGTVEATAGTPTGKRLWLTRPVPVPTDGSLLRHSPALDARWLDWGERSVVLVLYCWLVVRILIMYSADGRLANLLLLPSEGLVVVFLLLRRGTTAISRSPLEWLLALGATCAPLMVTPGVESPLIPPAAAALLLLFGMLLQIHAKLVLGRSFGCVPAHRGLKLNGPYRFVRHPMYAGYLLGHTAFLLINPTRWNAAIYLLCYATQIPRLLAEERLLRRDPAYRDYQSQVRFRLIPWLF
jgi:protein-S-isoprenylcysteine O-methyltransferase Ste14